MPAEAAVSILVVDDDEFNRIVATAMLRTLGYDDVVCAANGLEAVAACEKTLFDLILMDCEMPLMNGWEATRQIRARGVHTPVVAYTGRVDLDSRSRCTAAGMDDFIAKPCNVRDLELALGRWIRD
jgi:CheY-like chemotaxis protein